MRNGLRKIGGSTVEAWRGSIVKAARAGLDAVIKEISSTVESAKAKVPIVCPDP
jgi:hypothetical protein